MRTSVILGIALAGLMMSSCSKDQSQRDKLADQSITFNAGLKKATSQNALTTSWATNDQIGIFMVDHGTNTISQGASNRLYSNTATGFKATAGQEIYYPVSDSKVDFIAYYPYSAAIGSLGNYPIDISSQTNLAGIDLLWAKADNTGAGYNKTSSTNVPLTFDHKLAKLVILTKPAAGMDNTTTDWKGMAISIQGMNTKADFALANGAMTNPNSKANITPYTATQGAQYEAIVLPATFTNAGDLKITFQIGADVFTWSSQAGESFQAGKQYTYTIDITKTGVNFGGMTINDWTEVTRTGVAN